MAEEPQASKFDVSDLETTAAETPKAKHKRAGSKTEALPKSESKGGHLPGVHERPKKGRKVSSEGKLNASAAGEIGGMSDVEQSLQELRDIEKARVREEEDAEWEAKIAEAKGKIAAEDAEREAKIAEVKSEIAANDRDAKLASAPMIPPSKFGGVMPPPEGTKVPEYEQMTVETAPKEKKMRIPAIPPESEKSKQEHMKRLEEEQEEAWMRQGDDPAVLQEIESRRQDGASYDKDRKEVIIDDQETIDATVRVAEDMLRKGELNPDFFDIRDYEYLLTEQARLDRERTAAGFWEARKILKELEEVRKDLKDYVRQTDSVINARAATRAGTEVLTAREKKDIAYKGPMPKKELPQGSGTTVHKPGFFSRLFGKK